MLLLFLSSALYPLATMPAWIRVVVLNPTTYAAEGIRGALFGNTSSLNLWLCLAVLAGFAVVCTWFGLRSFRRLV